MLVVSGCIAKKGSSTITWTVNNLELAHKMYCQDSKDCKGLGIKLNRDRPTREKLPYKNKEKENLALTPEKHNKINMINVAKYYGNEQQFLDLLRFSIVFSNK